MKTNQTPIEKFKAHPLIVDPTIPLYGQKPGEGSVSENYYHCELCGGWIKGAPITRPVYREGTISTIVGQELCCRRCRQEIAFSVVVN